MNMQTRHLSSPPSSSVCTLTNDLPLTKWQRLLWLLINWSENSLDFCWYIFAFKACKFPSLGLSSFVVNVNSLEPKVFAINDSPIRIWCNLFWQHKITHIQRESLKKTVNILEFGCGTARYGLLLLNLFMDMNATYTGVDIKSSSSWHDLVADNKMQLFVDHSKNITRYLKDKDLIFTQSALEHFPDDIEFIKKIHSNRNQWSIHLLPSTSCLYTYLWHGYRQYSTKRLLKMIKTFDAEVKIYKIGGIFTNVLQLTDHLLPSLLLSLFKLRIKRFPCYSYRVKLAILLDSWLSRKGFQLCTSFLAIEILSKSKYGGE